jgi:hypothetical protein
MLKSIKCEFIQVMSDGFLKANILLRQIKHTCFCQISCGFHEVGILLLKSADLSHQFAIQNKTVVVIDDTIISNCDIHHIGLLNYFFFLVHFSGHSVFLDVLVVGIQKTLAPVVPSHWMNGAWIFWANTDLVFVEFGLPRLCLDQPAWLSHALQFLNASPRAGIKVHIPFPICPKPWPAGLDFDK